MIPIWLALLCVTLAWVLGWLSARAFFLLNAIRQQLAKETGRNMTFSEAAAYFDQATREK